MAVKIRMRRLGAKKKPFYRIVVADSRSPRNGRFIEEIGYYNPVSEPKQFRVDADKAKAWIANGAKPTDTVAFLFKKYEVLSGEGSVCSGVQASVNNEKVETIVEEEPAAEAEA